MWQRRYFLKEKASREEGCEVPGTQIHRHFVGTDFAFFSGSACAGVRDEFLFSDLLRACRGFAKLACRIAA
jgi:hypothetical protein